MTSPRFRLLVATLAILMLPTGSSRVSCQASGAQVSSRVLPAIVSIKGSTSPGVVVTGSGFLVDSSGTIVTNLHLIRGLRQIAVKLSTGDVYDHVTIQTFDERKDLAVIQIPGYNLPTLELGDSDTVRVGQPVLLIGNPLGILEGTVSSGIISGLRQFEEGYRVIQTDAAANPGNSGGPMVDAEGKVIGVVTFKIKDAESLNFVVPANYVHGLLGIKESIPLSDLEARLGRTSDLFSTKAYPSRWKSLASGTTKILRIDGDHLYIETILPEALLAAGDFILADLKRDGDKYIGIQRSRSTCTFTSSWDFSTKYKACTEQADIEIALLSSSRIEGTIDAYPEDEKFSCRYCTHSGDKAKKQFVWIPE